MDARFFFNERISTLENIQKYTRENEKIQKERQLQRINDNYNVKIFPTSKENFLNIRKERSKPKKSRFLIIFHFYCVMFFIRHPIILNTITDYVFGYFLFFVSGLLYINFFGLDEVRKNRIESFLQSDRIKSL